MDKTKIMQPNSKRKLQTSPDTCEIILHESGLAPVAGVDEAGRGPLAGPVVACAIILPPGLIIESVNDSKKLSESRRKALAETIKAAAMAYSYGIIDAATIDKINIHEATLLAMAQAIEALELRPKVLMVDGKFPPKAPCPTLHIIKGDMHSHLIAAASILAKVARDEIMQDIHREHPQYGFDKHKGYGTKAHKAALTKHGPCIVHRASFKF